MLSGRLRTFAAAVAAVGAFFLFGGSRAEAALELIVTVGSTTQVYYASSSNTMLAAVDIDGYHGQVDTTTTNFAGTPGLGFISTTLNISSIVSGSSPLTATVKVIAQVASLDTTPLAGTVAVGPLTGTDLTNVMAAALLSWSAPATSPVTVTANTATSSQALATAGSATTTTIYNGAGVATSGSLSLTALSPPSVLSSVSEPNSGTYTLGQSITLTGAASIGAINVTGTSTVTPSVPEPSTLALAGLGALGFIGFGLRRCKAAGA